MCKHDTAKARALREYLGLGPITLVTCQGVAFWEYIGRQNVGRYEIGLSKSYDFDSFGHQARFI